MKKINDISIIIPHYNSPNTLRRLLVSIGNHSGVKVIIVDDKSNKYLDEYHICFTMYSNENVTFLSNTSLNKGAGVCRNIGLEKANSKWILFADADDYFEPNWYEIVKKYLYSSYDIVYFKPNCSEINNVIPRIQLLQNMFMENTNDSKINMKLRYLFSPPWSKLFRSSLIHSNGITFDETMYANDVLFSVKTGYYAEEITSSDKSIYIVDEVADSLTKQITFNALYIRNEVMCRAYCFLRVRLPSNDFKALSYINFPLKYLITCLKQGFGLKNILKLTKVYKYYSIKIIRPIISNFFNKGYKL